MPDTENHLIQSLPLKDRRRLLAVCERVDLRLAEVLGDHCQAIRYAYFPVDGFISLLTAIDLHPGVEVGMVGREGMVGTELVLGVMSTPLRMLVQGGGAAWRVQATAFQQQLAASSALQTVLKRYLFVFLAQLTTACACPRHHMVGPRLARWLLMSQDRAHSATFTMTQEFLAAMLGVRRVSITLAAGALQRRGLIDYHRGRMTVLDRPGLAATACSCYAADRKVYAQQL